eukprot:997748-Prorocentrum_minimum.AAC.1
MFIIWIPGDRGWSPLSAARCPAWRSPPARWPPSRVAAAAEGTEGRRRGPLVLRLRRPSGPFTFGHVRSHSVSCRAAAPKYASAKASPSAGHVRSPLITFGHIWSHLVTRGRSPCHTEQSPCPPKYGPTKLSPLRSMSTASSQRAHRRMRRASSRLFCRMPCSIWMVRAYLPEG